MIINTIRLGISGICYPTYELCIGEIMVDAHLRSKTIETADIKNLIIGEQTGIDRIRFRLAAVTNGG
ncbi:hypothetical protein SDC9_55366 [bioreactor metagenome]|uniref:Uncharacterized protein n=1 Tax=bioreactor metagenome TaxID=1076179 RepID=A0A644WYQ7_9ZZZZ